MVQFQVSERFSLGTNSLFYHADVSAGPRHGVARRIVAQALAGDCWLTPQSLSEFYASVTRKRKVPPTEAAAQVRDWLSLFPHAVPSSASLVTAADLSAAGIASFWNALFIATAAQAGCTALLTEDMVADTTIAGVRIAASFDGDRMSPAAVALLAAD